MPDSTNDDDLNELSQYLRTTELGKQSRHFVDLDSTNDEAQRWLRSGAARHGAVVTTEQQSAGRGRLGRVWSSPEGGDLYVSVICRPKSTPFGVGALGLVIAVALRSAIHRVLNIDQVRESTQGKVQIDLKWPNDLLIRSRKLAGILCECRWTDGCPELVIGFGINVRRRQFESQSSAPMPTSLALEWPHVRLPGRAIMLAAILYDLENYLERYFLGGFAQVREEYEQACITLGKRVRISSTSHIDGHIGGPMASHMTTNVSGSIAGSAASRKSSPAKNSGTDNSISSVGPSTAFTASQDQQDPVFYIAESLDPDGALRVRPLNTGPSFRVESADVWLADDSAKQSGW